MLHPHSYILPEKIVALKQPVNIYPKGNIYCENDRGTERRYNESGEGLRMTMDAAEMKEEKRILSRSTRQQYLSLNSNGKMPRKIYQPNLVKIKNGNH